MNLLEAETLAAGLIVEERDTPGYSALLDQLQAALGEGTHTGLIFDAFLRHGARNLCRKVPTGHDIHNDGLYIGWNLETYDQDFIERLIETLSSYICGNVRPVFDAVVDLTEHVAALPDSCLRGRAVGQFIAFIRELHEDTLEITYQQEAEEST